MMQLTEYCNPLKCKIYGDGWCEYDFATDCLVPHNPNNCPLINKEKKNNKDKTIKENIKNECT